GRAAAQRPGGDGVAGPAGRPPPGGGDGPPRSEPGRLRHRRPPRRAGAGAGRDRPRRAGGSARRAAGRRRCRTARPRDRGRLPSMEGRPRAAAGTDRPPVLTLRSPEKTSVMPTNRGRRALVACLLALVAWLATSAVAGAAPADPTAEPTPAPTTTTVAPPATTTTTVVRATTTTTARPTTTTTVQIRAAAVNTPSAPTLAETNTVTGPAGTADGKASVSLDLGGLANPDKPSQSLLIIVLITLLSVAPALLIMLTSFTRIVIVLSLTRNALGLHTIPPNQVIVGLAMFLSFFVMSPTFGDINKNAVQPLLHGQ